MRVFVLGEPGAGARTQAALLARRLGVLHLAFGPRLREPVRPSAGGRIRRRAGALPG
jgi:adenylate kinase family enzyme